MSPVTEPTWTAITELHVIDHDTSDYLQVTVIKALPGRLILTDEPTDDVYIIIERTCDDKGSKQ